MPLPLNASHLTQNKIQNSHPAYHLPPDLPTKLLSDITSNHSWLPPGITTTQVSSPSLKHSTHGPSCLWAFALSISSAWNSVPGLCTAHFLCSSPDIWMAHSSTLLGPLFKAAILDKLCLIAIVYVLSLSPFAHFYFSYRFFSLSHIQLCVWKLPVFTHYNGKSTRLGVCFVHSCMSSAWPMPSTAVQYSFFIEQTFNKCLLCEWHKDGSAMRESPYR